MKRVIAIDGPSGAGKSTVARLLASRLGFDFLDTGALYRAIGLKLMRCGLDDHAADDLISPVLKETRVSFRDGRIMLDDEDVTETIRTPEAGHYASVFSARGAVRQFLLRLQRQAAESSDIVAEGRDMTTVVFPGAFRKIFLDASVAERTRRRTRELIAKGHAVDEQQVRRDIIERDERDSKRQIAPLRRSDDAFLIDSTGLTVEEVLEKILTVVGEG